MCRKVTTHQKEDVYVILPHGPYLLSVIDIKGSAPTTRSSARAWLSKLKKMFGLSRSKSGAADTLNIQSPEELWKERLRHWTEYDAKQ